MNRSTITRHRIDVSNEHLDIFLETPTHLETYEASIEKFSLLLEQKKILCSKKNLHRKLYLDYEGEISGSRGILKILWKGFYWNDNGNFPEEVNLYLLDNENLKLEF